MTITSESQTSSHVSQGGYLKLSKRDLIPRWNHKLDERLLRAMWEGDLDKLDELAGCGCCCAEHFFEDCPARIWGGCRGQHSLTRKDYAAWEEHYRKHHGLSRDQFYGVETIS